METIIFIAGIIISVYILKEQFKKKNPSVRGRSVAGLFVAPVLLTAFTGGFLYDALHLNIIDSQSWWGIALSFINEQRGSAAESIYYESAETYASVAKVCFFVTICSVGYLLFKLFDDDECNKSLMHILIGIGTVACSVTVYYSGKSFLSVMHYLGQDCQEEFPIYCLLAVLAFLFWAWYYFNVSLKDVLSLSTAKSKDKLLEKEKSEMSMTDKTQNLMNLKSLLDSGVLTQEEFDAQKKEILNS
jgi:hypothetical protein